jgi:hypothetical protein
VDIAACYAAHACTVRRNEVTAESNEMRCHPTSPPEGVCINGVVCTAIKKIPNATYKLSSRQSLRGGPVSMGGLKKKAPWKYGMWVHTQGM